MRYVLSNSKLHLWNCRNIENENLAYIRRTYDHTYPFRPVECFHAFKRKIKAAR
jgi:hypothetical protein